MDQHDGSPTFALVGIDPNSEDVRCPGVWVEEETEDLYMRGKVVTDPLILARLEQDAPSSADEAVVRMPARMREMIADAATGNYEPTRVGHGDIELIELLKRAQHSAIHLETRDTYDPDNPAFKDWLAGGTGRAPRTAWRTAGTSMTERGVKIRRARVISSPPTDYIRWEHMVTDVNLEIGEEVRWLTRDSAPDLLVPTADFWLIDNRLIVFNTCTGAGAHHRDHYSNDPEVIGRCLLAFERIWERAVPHAEFKLD
ncbi:DUF6879 family protein [Actinocorallia longicatena]|uniref:DUF6879 domain-containing protein n=1 Tax=Actinocorallia longicatena TaxID=111803 RepID=A0ABP6QFA6_9ACTN